MAGNTAHGEAVRDEFEFPWPEGFEPLGQLVAGEVYDGEADDS